LGAQLFSGGKKKIRKVSGPSRKKKRVRAADELILERTKGCDDGLSPSSRQGEKKKKREGKRAHKNPDAPTQKLLNRGGGREKKKNPPGRAVPRKKRIPAKAQFKKKKKKRRVLPTDVSYPEKKKRGRGGSVLAKHELLNELIAFRGGGKGKKRGKGGKKSAAANEEKKKKKGNLPGKSPGRVKAYGGP